MTAINRDALLQSDTVMPFHRDGAWRNSHSPYYRFAHHEAAEYSKTIDLLSRGEELLAAEQSNVGSEVAYEGGIFDDEDLLGLHEVAYRHSIGCHLFACMSLEGFLNTYGVRRLGERFYQQNLERMGISEKFAVIGMCCSQWVVAPDSEVCKDIRQLFDDRNRLVHPKTREIRWDRLEDAVYVHPSQLPVSDTMLRLERCIDFLVRADNSIVRNFYFRR